MDEIDETYLLVKYLVYVTERCSRKSVSLQKGSSSMGGVVEARDRRPIGSGGLVWCQAGGDMRWSRDADGDMGGSPASEDFAEGHRWVVALEPRRIAASGGGSLRLGGCLHRWGCVGEGLRGFGWIFLLPAIQVFWAFWRAVFVAFLL